MHLGEVLDTADPEGLGRVKVRVPGLLDPESTWAFPGGRMFGAENGIFGVPEVGSNVLVWLQKGDVDSPYFLPGPYGAPGGQSDVPGQAPSGSPDHFVIRWRGFHLTLDGTSGAEKLTIEDLGSGTKLEIDRVTGDHTRDVEGDEVVTIAQDLDVEVEGGDETHKVSAGDRVTEVTLGNDTRNVLAGNDALNVPIGGSTETMAAGAKTISALNVGITGSAGVTVSSGGAISISGGQVSINSGAGTSVHTSGGLRTRSFLGGIAESITGVWGAAISGILTFLGAILNMGLGVVPTISPGYRRLLNEELILNWINIHSHAALGAAPTQKIQLGTGTIPDSSIAPNVDERLIRTSHLWGS